MASSLILHSQHVNSYKKVYAPYVARCRVRFICGHASILLLAMAGLVPTAFTQELLYARIQVPSKSSLEVGRLFRLQINAQGIASVNSGMCNLMHYTVEILIGRSGSADNNHRLPVPRTSIGQTCITLSATEIPISLSHHIHIGTYGLQFIKNDISIFACGVNVSLDYPVVLLNTECVCLHKNIAQSTGIRRNIILTYQHPMTSPSAASVSSMTILM